MSINIIFNKEHWKKILVSNTTQLDNDPMALRRKYHMSVMDNKYRLPSICLKNLTFHR